MTNWRGIPEEYRNKIVKGDAWELMRGLPPECVDIIITSPPWNVGLNYEGYEDNLPEGEYRKFMDVWIRWAFQLSSEGTRLYMIVSDLIRYWVKDLAEDHGWKWVQDLTWCKPNMVSRIKTSFTSDWAMMTENIILFRKGKRTPMLNGGSHAPNTFSWFVETVPQSNYREGRIHPAQLPLSLCRRIISRTPGQIVLDPFSGSGSVLVAAKELGRSFLGFDIVQSVVDKANERLRTTTPPLLVPRPEQLDLMP